MPETFQAFHAKGAQESESVLGLPFAWGAVTFNGVLSRASVPEDSVEDPGSLNALLLKTRSAQFIGAIYPQLNAIITGGGKRYRVVNDVHTQRNDPFITIPIVEIPTS